MSIPPTCRGMEGVVRDGALVLLKAIKSFLKGGITGGKTKNFTEVLCKCLERVGDRAGLLPNTFGPLGGSHSEQADDVGDPDMVCGVTVRLHLERERALQQEAITVFRGWSMELEYPWDRLGVLEVEQEKQLLR